MGWVAMRSGEKAPAVLRKRSELGGALRVYFLVENPKTSVPILSFLGRSEMDALKFVLHMHRFFFTMLFN